MGRRLLIALAITGLPVGAMAVPAVASAKTHKHAKVLVVSTKLSKAHSSLSLPRTGGGSYSFPSFPYGNETNEYTGFLAECTVPVTNTSDGANIHSTDTDEFLSGNLLDMVLSCSANLKTTKDVNGNTVQYNTTKIVTATVHSCEEYNVRSKPTPTLQGTGISVTYPDGLFVETCTSVLPPL